VLVLVCVLMRMLVLVTVLMIALGDAVVRHIHLRWTSDVEGTR
jgi:Flp pilus assembly pilin Flp